MDASQACVDVGLRNEKIAVMRHRVLCFDREEDKKQLGVLEDMMSVSELFLNMDTISQVTRRAVTYRQALVLLDVQAIREICHHMSSPTEEDILCRLLSEQVTQEMEQPDTVARIYQQASLLDIIYSITHCIQITDSVRPELFLLCVSLKRKVINDMLVRMLESSPTLA